MITFQPASPTVFMYETSPTYWQVQAATEEDRSDTEQLRPSRTAFRNLQVTNDPSCLCFSMQLSSSARDLKVEMIGDRLYISCTYRGHKMVVDRILKDKRLVIEDVTAEQTSSGVLTVRIPKTRKKRSKADPVSPLFRIPVADAYADENLYTSNRNSWSDPSVKRLELEIPFQIQSRAIQVVFDENQQKLLVSGRRPGPFEPSFTSKFNISSQRIQVQKLQARLFRTSSNDSLLVITAPIFPSTDSIQTTPQRRLIPIQVTCDQQDDELWLVLSPSESTQSSKKSHKMSRHQITPAALALSHTTPTTLASSSVQQLKLECSILKNQILESNVAAVEAAVDYYSYTTDARKMIPETLRRLV